MAKMRSGFTLVELVIVIVIVGILALIAAPTYKGMVEKAKMSEGKALLGAIKNAESIYYAQYGQYLEVSSPTGYNAVLGIDARANKYFKNFSTLDTVAYANAFRAIVRSVDDTSNTISLWWALDPNLPATISGHSVPVYAINFDGKQTFSNS